MTRFKYCKDCYRNSKGECLPTLHNHAPLMFRIPFLRTFFLQPCSWNPVSSHRHLFHLLCKQLFYVFLDIYMIPFRRIGNTSL